MWKWSALCLGCYCLWSTWQKWDPVVSYVAVGAESSQECSSKFPNTKATYKGLTLSWWHGRGCRQRGSRFLSRTGAVCPLPGREIQVGCVSDVSDLVLWAQWYWSRYPSWHHGRYPVSKWNQRHSCCLFPVGYKRGKCSSVCCTCIVCYRNTSEQHSCEAFRNCW